MPWVNKSVNEQRLRFIGDWLSEDFTITELCLNYGISRDTGHRLIARYKQFGLDGLKDRSSAPHAHPNQTPVELVTMILKLRAKQPSWGPDKLRRRLQKKHPELTWPAASTIGAILDRAGVLVKRRSRVPAFARAASPKLTGYDEAIVYCIDFKGDFRVGDGRRCYPLTLIEGSSRFLLRCQGLTHKDLPLTWAVLEAAFRQYGLPDVIRSDNGTPFCSSRAVGGLTKLSVWWIKLGIRPERIDPGCPDQNGRLERFHKTLKDETANPPMRDLVAQQRKFDRFRRSYNLERPHESLGQETPASCYQRSRRPYPRKVKDPEYPDGVVRRRVNRSGKIRWQDGIVPVGGVLAGELVGLQAVPGTDERYWRLFFGRLPLALWDVRYGDWLSQKEIDKLLKTWPKDGPTWYWKVSGRCPV